MKSLKVLALAAVVAPLLAVATPSQAVLIFENGVESSPNFSNGDPSPNLVDPSNSINNAAGIQNVIDENTVYLGVDVDFVGRVNDGDGDTFGASGSAHGFDAIGSVSVTCTQSKDGGGCIAFDWSFDRSSLASDWQIVKIGVKGGTRMGFWALDPFADSPTDIVTGSFGCADYAKLFTTLGCLTSGPTIKAISHIDFFGTVNDIPPPPKLPEPLTLALFGLGLVGLGMGSRRHR